MLCPASIPDPAPSLQTLSFLSACSLSSSVSVFRLRQLQLRVNSPLFRADYLGSLPPLLSVALPTGISMSRQESKRKFSPPIHQDQLMVCHFCSAGRRLGLWAHLLMLPLPHSHRELRVYQHFSRMQRRATASTSLDLPSSRLLPPT